MKAKFLFLPAALLMLASCSSNDDPVFEQTITLQAINLVTPDDSDMPSNVQKASYTMKRDLTQGLVDVGSNVTFNNVTYNFQTGYLPTRDASVDIFGAFRFSSPYVSITGNESQRIQAFTGLATSYIWTPNILGLTGLNQMPVVSDVNNALVLSYDIPGLFSVKTLPIDSFYAGTTTTTFNGTSASSDDVVFRFTVNPADNTANVAIYNAQFAPQMPKLTFVLLGLKFIPGRNTYTIEGENIIPQGADQTPYPNFPFLNFKLTPSTGDLTSIKVDFQVTERFHGSFEGSFLRTAKN